MGETIDNYPAVCWTDSALQKLIYLLNRRWRRKQILVRLPTCEEWKKVALRRDEMGHERCSCEIEKCSVNFDRGMPLPVNEGKPDSLNFYYLCGNVGEYCRAEGSLLWIGANYDAEPEWVFKKYEIQLFKLPFVGVRLVVEKTR